jgi:hypothetical protein
MKRGSFIVALAIVNLFVEEGGSVSVLEEKEEEGRLQVLGLGT